MTIKVRVFRRSSRKFYLADWTDPVTGRRKRLSTQKVTKRDAERFAGDLEKRLNEGTYREPSKVEWSAFRDRYETDVLPGLAPKTAKKAAAAFNVVEKHIAPKQLAALTAEQLSAFTAKLRKAGLSIACRACDGKEKGCGACRGTGRLKKPISESTIKAHLSHLRAAMRWAKRVGMLVEVPTFDMPKRTKQARHRAPTTEEFERMLAKARDVVVASRKVQGAHLAAAKSEEATTVESWKFLLRGLWASGLRLGEALNLTWDDERKLCVRLGGRFPMLWIPAELQKNHQNMTVPLAPEFAELLLTVPQAWRTGFVFNPARLDGHDPERTNGARSGRLRPHRVGVTIAQIGKAANVAVNIDPDSDITEFASAHDLRRSFGFRWSQRVMPAVLKEMMRHSSITTTMQFYAVSTAEATAATLWAAHRDAGSKTAVGDTFGATSRISAEA